MLFAELEALNGKPEQVDLERARLKCLLADRIIDTMRIEVQFAAVMKGALDVPFIEHQADERSGDAARQSHRNGSGVDTNHSALSSSERTARLLASGPTLDHAWRRSRRDKD